MEIKLFPPLINSLRRQKITQKMLSELQDESSVKRQTVHKLQRDS
jgi:hypothetical protein